MTTATLDPKLQAKRARALTRLEAIARTMDDGIPVPFADFRVGLDPVISVLPGGNLIPLAVGAYTIFEAVRLGVPLKLVLKMIGRIVLDALLGAIPVLGAIFDVFFKAHRLNLDELVAYLNAEDEARSQA